MLKVAIIGCGKIADAHAEQLQHVQGCQMVGVCDQEELMAKQLYERFPVKAFFSNAEELLTKARPDVVHITTPPQSHFQLGQLCLEHGCHIYVEKPFTVNATEARELVRLAEKRKLKLTVGNDPLFTPAAQYFRRLVQDGYLGGDPVHLESYYCYELEDAYARALLGDRRHWVRTLPGKLLHNIISHGVVRIAEFVRSDRPKLLAYGSTSPTLRKLGEREIIDELRVILADDDRLTAYFTFSSQMRPSLHQFRIYGPQNALMLDDDQQCVIKLRGRRYKSYAEKFIPPVGYARQYLSNFARSLNLFLRRDFHMKAGLRNLINEFYNSIANDRAVPISYRDIVLTCQIMDDIFQQLPSASLKADFESLGCSNHPVARGTANKKELAIQS